MTTLEEIQTCPEANRAFWTAMAASHLNSYRAHKTLYAKRCFRECMAHRRAKTYLESA